MIQSASMWCFGKAFTSCVSLKHQNIKSDEETEAGHLTRLPEGISQDRDTNPTKLMRFPLQEQFLPCAGPLTRSTENMHVPVCTWGSQAPRSPHPRLGTMRAGGLYRSLQHSHATVLGELGI